MKLTTVIASVNNNPEYYQFIPKQISFWNHFGIRFLTIFVNHQIPDELSEYSNNIILWDKTHDLNPIYVAQNIRMYYTAILDLPENEMVMLTDMDMLPCSDTYFKKGLEEFHTEDFIYYRNIDHENRQIYICYNAAHPSTWAKCFGISNISDIEKQLYENYTPSYDGKPGYSGWFIDQEILYRALKDYPHLKVLDRPIRRLETWDYQRHLDSGDTGFYLQYDDAHFHRSYVSNRGFIENAEQQLNPC